MNEVTAPYYNVQNEHLRNEAMRDALLLGAGGTAAAGAAGAYLGGQARGKTVRTIEEILKAIPSKSRWAAGGAAALGIPIGLGTASAALVNRLGYDDEKSPIRGAAAGAAVGGAAGGAAGEVIRRALAKKLPSLGISRMATLPPLALAGALFGGLSGAGAGYIQRMKARKQLRELLSEVNQQGE